MHCSVIEHGYDVIEFSNCSTEERGVQFENEMVQFENEMAS